MPHPIPDETVLVTIEEAAREWARRTGELLLPLFRHSIAVEFKQENRRDPVTEADRAAETFLRQAIGERFPDHGVLGEEGTETSVASADYLWVLDPLDGTTNFAYGLPFFAVSIGVLFRRRPVVGCIYAPTTPHLRAGVYHARSGGGAWFEDERLFIPPCDKPDSAGISGLPGAYRGFFRVVGKPQGGIGDHRSLGSIAYEVAMVADGALQSAFFARPRIWDVAAGVVLIREAGGQALAYSRRRKGWLPVDEFHEASKPEVSWLERFLMPPPKKPVPTGLRAWTAPLVVGSPAAAGYFAGHVRPRMPSPRMILGLMWRRLRARAGSKSKRSTEKHHGTG